MLRPFLLAALFAPALSAQTPEQQLKEAWARYAQLDLVGDADKASDPRLPAALDALGAAWSIWAKTQGPAALKLPTLPPAKDADPPSTRVLARHDSWVLLGLEVPVPCGSHTFMALYKTHGEAWALATRDLHEPRSGADPIGARENIQALLLNGPRIVIASTPPWCTSCWSVLHVRALTPGTDPDHSKLLAHFEDRVYRCADDGAFQMTPVKGGIRLRYEGMVGLDGGTSARKRVLRIPER